MLDNREIFSAIYPIKKDKLFSILAIFPLEKFLVLSPIVTSYVIIFKTISLWELEIRFVKYKNPPSIVLWFEVRFVKNSPLSIS